LRKADEAGGQWSASNEQQQVKPGGCCVAVSKTYPTVVMTRARKTGTTLGRLSNQRPNAALTAMPLKARVARKMKDPEFEWIHMAPVDREESQVGATYSITGADKQDGDGDG
jgi:hypothetical protein